jgi:hypothetical protein
VTKYSYNNYGEGKWIISVALFVHFELAIYTKLLLALGGSNHGGKGNLIYFGTIGEVMCHVNRKINCGSATNN